MISVEAAERVESWVEEAAQAGAAVLCGGQRVGAFMDPTILEGVPPQARLVSEEAFGPVAIVQPFEAFDEALSVVNASRYGLQAGVFTASLSHAFRAWNTLDVGAVIINDVPTTRLDAMPYGGVKDSGVGREGVRYAILEMTEMRTMMLRNVGKVRGASSSGRRETAADEKSLSDTQAVFEARGPDDTQVPI
jgi:acyl-CoA reductase-like NAD-dependent aldehyde dehydrogenase